MTQLEPAHVIFLRARLPRLERRIGGQADAPYSHVEAPSGEFGVPVRIASARLIALRARKRLEDHGLNTKASHIRDLARKGSRIRAWWAVAARELD